MKLALFFLSCFIALSQQQNAFWSQYQAPLPVPYHGLRQWNNIYSGASPYSFFQRPWQYQPFVSRQQRPNMVLVDLPVRQYGS